MRMHVQLRSHFLKLSGLCLSCVGSIYMFVFMRRRNSRDRERYILSWDGQLGAG